MIDDLPRTHTPTSHTLFGAGDKPGAPIAALAWEALIQDAPACVGVVDAAGKHLYANTALERIFGLLPNGFNGRGLETVVPRGVAHPWREQLQWVVHQRAAHVLIAVLRGVCWRVTFKPVHAAQIDPIDAFTDPAEDDHHAAHAQMDSLATPSTSPGPVLAVLCVMVRLSHVTSGESPPSAFPGRGLPVLPAIDLGPLAKLTPRELQVLRLVGMGLTIAQMAKRVHRADKTLEWHRNALGIKLSIRNRVDLARLAIENGYTALSDEQMDQLLAVVDKESSPRRSSQD